MLNDTGGQLVCFTAWRGDDGKFDRSAAGDSSILRHWGRRLCFTVINGGEAAPGVLYGSEGRGTVLRQLWWEMAPAATAALCGTPDI